MSVAAKICGLQDTVALNAAVEGGAHYVGFVFCPTSRHVVTAEVAAALIAHVPPSVTAVGLFVDPTDADLQAVLAHAPLGLVQLHGLETPERVAAVRQQTGLPVMKVLHVSTPEDVTRAKAYESIADLLLFDTKIGPLPTGGTGRRFDWSLMRGRSFARPWMLAGGLNAENLAEAVHQTGATIVDVSSGVEDGSGHKDPARIRAFLDVAACLPAGSQKS